MIWILWFIWIEIEIVLHWFIINVIQYDLTPDHKFITWSKIIVIGARLAAYYFIWYEFAEHTNTAYIMFTLGCLFTHLLIFPIQLNLMSGKPAHYLGKGFVDKALALFPAFIFRVWCLAVLSSGMIYGYYHTDLL